MTPLAFRIWDFKSITDSGECQFSADNITVLAGQNESGKTAILQALRDFDLNEGLPPRTSDYTPDGRLDSAKPRVAAKFSLDARDLDDLAKEEGVLIPSALRTKMLQQGYIWVIRDLPTGQFDLDAEFQRAWGEAMPGGSGDFPAPVQASEATLSVSAPSSGVEPRPEEPKTCNSGQFATALQHSWPAFVYFDSFEDALPRTVDVSILQTLAETNKASVAAAASTIPQPVQDYITLAGLDLAIIQRFSTENKALNNYLSTRSAQITGDFLTYWKQKAGTEQTVTLQVRHQRSPQGVQQLAFYVHDQTDEYPEQRSKGFLWFLSFYLRLAAEHQRSPDRERILLIDEPGTYLHARAQQDVLHLLEDRLSRKDQIVYSTHSTYLIPGDKLHRLRLVLKAPETGTLVVDRLTHPLLRGAQFSDTLSPILSAIGLDIRQAAAFVRDKNLIVEGISDYYYVTAWSGLTDLRFTEHVHIFPATGATSEVTLASLFIGWGIPFVALMDREQIGNAARDKLIRELGVPEKRVIQPDDALGIEDLLSEEDFRRLLLSLDAGLTINPGEKPTACMKRQRIDKVLLARKFAENHAQGVVVLGARTRDRVAALLSRIMQAFT